MIEPDVFWSDIILGFIALLAAFTLRRYNNSWWIPFIFLTLATWIGAFYHGFINHTNSLMGEILWTGTLILFFAASATIIVLIKNSRLAKVVASIGLVLYAFWAIIVSEKFIWALVIQGVSILVYFLACIASIVRERNSNSIRAACWLLIFIAFDVFAIYVQITKQTYGFNVSHNTIFHILEMPAIIALALSMYNYEFKKTLR